MVYYRVSAMHSDGSVRGGYVQDSQVIDAINDHFSLGARVVYCGLERVDRPLYPALRGCPNCRGNSYAMLPGPKGPRIVTCACGEQETWRRRARNLFIVVGFTVPLVVIVIMWLSAWLRSGGN